MTNRLKPTLIKISIHYAIVISAFTVIFGLFPGTAEYFPVGTTERLFSTTADFELESSIHSGRLEEESKLAHGLYFALCFISSILISVPVGATYLGTQSKKKTNPSIAKAIVLLPIAVTGLVLIIQNSLALAFGLAGIVAGSGIRFRTNLKEFTDTLYFLISIGIGLSAGVGALGLSLLMSMIFCYAISITYAVDYGNLSKNDKKKPKNKDKPELTSDPDNKSDDHNSSEAHSKTDENENQ